MLNNYTMLKMYTYTHSLYMCSLYTHSLYICSLYTVTILSLLRENRFFLKAKKCTIATHEAEVLGHKINAEGIHTTEKITKAVKEFPRLTNRTELRSFLGLAGYYRSFILGFSRIAKPLNDLLRKDISFCWKDEQQEAFDTLKEKLVTAPILKRPDLKQPFILYTDASAFGLGAILSQK